MAVPLKLREERQNVPCFAVPIKAARLSAGLTLTGPDGSRRHASDRGQQVARGKSTVREDRRDALLALLAGRPIVLVGMMGAGKTTVGRRLAAQLGRRFVDSDEEIEKAAGMSIEDIFATHGEADFRAGEVRVIARLLRDPDLVLGTGGGAFINPETRALVKSTAVSVWIKADFELLYNRVSRRGNRPLLKTADPRDTLRKLIEKRYPIYGEADVTIVSTDAPHDAVAGDIVDALVAFLGRQQQREDAAHGE
ncbi:shikimate kinase [Devosia sp.]|uniref:shikimate kinase n=1 Tax=Devosia sp. TaxID=1871048 RepID=UPI003751426B